jgi:hypothetical protein
MNLRTLTLAILLMVMFASPLALAKKKDQTPQFQFTCMNYWNQEKLVVVAAQTEDEARQKLKTDPDLYSEYRNTCSALGRAKEPQMAKKPKTEAPVTPGE